MLRLQRRDDRRNRRDAPALEQRVGEYSGPALEELDRFGTRLNLTVQELDDGSREQVDQGLEPLRIAQRPLLEDGVLRAAERETAERLQGDLDRMLGRVAQPHHPARSLADVLVLRQIASGLPHEPDRWSLGALARKRTQQQLLRPRLARHGIETYPRHAVGHLRTGRGGRPIVHGAAFVGRPAFATKVEKR